MTIRPISDLKNYQNVLEEIAALQLLLELNKTNYENVVPYDEVKNLFAKQ